MKRNLLLAGIIGLLLVFGTAIAGCDLNKDGDGEGEEEETQSVIPTEHKVLVGKWYLLDDIDKADKKPVFEITSDANLKDDETKTYPMIFPEEADSRRIKYKTSAGEPIFCEWYTYIATSKTLKLIGGEHDDKTYKQDTTP
jgi:hypothetical protein